MALLPSAPAPVTAACNCASSVLYSPSVTTALPLEKATAVLVGESEVCVVSPTPSSKTETTRLPPLSETPTSMVVARLAATAMGVAPPLRSASLEMPVSPAVEAPEIVARLATSRTKASLAVKVHLKLTVMRSTPASSAKVTAPGARLKALAIAAAAVWMVRGAVAIVAL